MSDKLKDTKVAILSTNGFEQSELFEPLKALKDAGADVKIVSPHSDSIKGWSGDNWGDSIDVDMTIADALGRVDEFDALVLPGGVANPDSLRTNEDAIEFTRAFFKAGKPVSAICHAPQLLIECDVLQGREVTSYHSIKTDLKNAGARWVDKECVCDRRSPPPARRMISRPSSRRRSRRSPRAFTRARRPHNSSNDFESEITRTPI